MKPDTNGGRSSATPPNAVRRLERKKPAHFSTLEVGFRSIIIFLTVCTHRRKPLLANEDAARRLIAAWRAANFWRVGRYVIMPDHIHLFCAPNTFPPQPLKNWISFWRNHVTRAWPQRDEAPIWQRDYWDRQLRCGESYAQKWEYVENNPVRHGHVARAQDWPIKVSLIFWNGTIDDFFGTLDEGTNCVWSDA